jgi:membrane protein DedA with SNARE-associated domain
VRYSFLGGIVWSSFLVAMGYFYGYLWREIRDDIKYIGWIIFAIAIVTFVFITIYKNKQAKKLLKSNSDNE